VLKTIENDVEVQTADGVCNVAFVHPETGPWPPVIMWPDAGGLRPVMREMAKRLAAEGYSVLVPNPFYRLTREERDSSKADFRNPEYMAALQKLMGSIGAPGAAEKDAAAFIAFIDGQDSVDRSKRIGTQGYCMGGKLALRTGAIAPDRVGAVASFHGGGLVTDQPDSPHRLAPKIDARVYIAIAKNDDDRQPEAKDILRDAFGPKAEVELYGSLHGWCIRDMPVVDGQALYNAPDAERAWAKLLALYKAALG
jgi:carboxymethylenebutenolidase